MDSSTTLKLGGSSTKVAVSPEITVEHLFEIMKQAAMTTQLTALTYTDPSTPDYAIQDLTTTSPYGFKTKDEGNTVLSVIANLQTRVAELETALKAAKLLA